MVELKLPSYCWGFIPFPLTYSVKISIHIRYKYAYKEKGLTASNKQCRILAEGGSWVSVPRTGARYGRLKFPPQT
jgi:hypothetical protein